MLSFFSQVLCLMLIIMCTELNAQHYSFQDSELVIKVDRILSEHHVDYHRIDTLIKQRFLKSLLNQVDPRSKYFIQPDVDSLESALQNFQLSEEYTLKMLEELRVVFESRLTTTKNILGEIKNLDFHAPDTIVLNTRSDSLSFAESDEELKLFWTRLLKLRILLRYKGDSLAEGMSQEDLNQFLNEKLKFEVSAKICGIESLLSGERLKNYILEAYIKAYCLSFDPHTNYLSPQAEDDLWSELSSNLYSTGITYGRRGSIFYVASISPFSHASFNEDIHVGDEITGILSDGNLLSLSCLPLEKRNELFYGEEKETIEIELRSSRDSQLRRFVLAKSVVDNTINHTYSFLLQNEDIKIGYVQFESFYLPLSENGRSSAQDLAFILLKFKKMGVDGVIVDLRNNGGGSMAEAADMLSYFTDYGPLFSIKSQQDPRGALIKDTKKGKVWDSKIIFIVNALSASASELVAAVVQEYPNYLVVGSPTFGKATGQTVIPVRTGPQNKNRGVVSVTDMKIFEFDGGNYQGHGVTPDISLPTPFNKSLASETHYDNVLNHGFMREFRPVRYRDEPIDTLISLYEKRNSLQRLDSIRQQMVDYFSKPQQISLQFDAFENPNDLLLNIDRPISDNIEIISLEEDEAFFEISNLLKGQRQTDPILHETFRIFQDWIDLTTTN